MAMDLQFFHQGGFFMWSLIGVSFIALAITFERLFLLKFKYAMKGRIFFAEIKKDLLEGQHRRALEYAKQFKGVPLAEVLAAGIERIHKPIHQIDHALETETLNFIPRITRRLNYLPSLANIATLFGLLGTITGLILAFKSVGVAQAAGLTREQGLAGGIAVAMYTTAFGLVVAIPTSLAYLYLANAANRLVEDIDYFASAFKNLVQDMSTGQIERPVSREEKPVQKQSSQKETAQKQSAQKPAKEFRREPSVKPFSEEAGKLLASASAVTNVNKDFEFAEENTRIANKGRVSLRRDRKTDSMTAPELDEYTDEATQFEDGE